MSHETIYWTHNDKRLCDSEPVWRTNRVGDVVIVGQGVEYPRHADGTRMTIADMDACKNCKRCQANGKPLEVS